MPRLKTRIRNFLLDVRTPPGTIPSQTTIMVMGFYAITLAASFIIPFRASSDYAMGELSSALIQSVFLVLCWAAIFILWKTRAIVAPRFIYTIAISMLCAMLVLEQGGSYGLGYLYIIAGYPVAYFVLGIAAGIIVPLGFLFGIIVQAFFGSPLETNVFYNPIMADRMVQALSVATVLGIAAVLYQHLLLKRLGEVAYTDNVTGLANRASLETTLTTLLNPTITKPRSFSLLSVRLLQFDLINTNQGTSRGDDALRVCAERLKALQIPGGTWGRYSGTGFALVSSLGGYEALEKLAYQVRAQLQEPIQADGGTINLQAVVAITRHPQDGKSAEKLFSNILSVHGRQMVSPQMPVLFYDEDQFQAERRRYAMAKELAKAIENNELSLVYHPKVVIASGQAHGAEVLLRWTNLNFGVVSPADFIPIAEETGLIRDITSWVISQASKELASVDSAYPGTPLIHAINVSPLDLGNPSIISHILGCLDSARIRTDSIEIEITEGVLMDKNNSMQNVLQEFRQRGFRIAIDDFGTGYSSLSYLHQLQINNLKIDQSFVRMLELPGNSSATIVQAIIRMAQSLKLDITAEGVENSNQATILKEMGCTYGQGWLWSKPLSIKAYREWLKTTHSNSDRT